MKNMLQQCNEKPNEKDLCHLYVTVKFILKK